MGVTDTVEYPDYYIASIAQTPLTTGVQSLIVVLLGNQGAGDGTTSVTMELTPTSGTGQTTTLISPCIYVASGKKAIAFVTHTFSKPGTYSLRATANAGSYDDESLFTNNTRTGTINVVKEPEYAAPAEEATKRRVPDLPEITEARQTKWTDNSSEYKANITLSCDSDIESSKSGYGFTILAKSKTTSSFPSTALAYQPQKIYAFLPEYGYEKAIELDNTENGWEFPVNATSVTGHRKWYIPVWWPDGSEYTMLLQTVGAYTAGGELIATETVTVRVDSNLYTDDYSVN